MHSEPAEPHAPLLHPGERVEVAGRLLTVTDRAHECLPRVREYLVEVARSGGTTTYGELVADLDLPYHPRALGRLLALLTEDCRRRDEPTLAALVVNRTTGEIGGDCVADPAGTREALRRRWATG